MRTWTATTTTGARPEAVLEVLTDPAALQAAVSRVAREAAVTNTGRRRGMFAATA
jgi:hypothetical protein